MKRDKDAYGQEIWHYFKGKPSFEIVERDDGFISTSSAGAAAYFAPYKDWPICQKKAIAYAKGRVLDIGCGAGRVGLYLQKKGLDVTSIDNSPLAIKICKERKLKKAINIPIEKIGKFRNGSFDTVIMFGNNFGLFGSFKKAKFLLKKMNKITSKNAILITENIEPYKTTDTAHINYHKFNKKRGRMAGQLRIRIRFRQYTGNWFDYLLVSQKEMKGILKGTGWKVKRFINSNNYMYTAIIEKE